MSDNKNIQISIFDQNSTLKEYNYISDQSNKVNSNYLQFSENRREKMRLVKDAYKRQKK